MEGQKMYLMKQIFRIQSLAKGFLARNHFYQNIKQTGYLPINKFLKKKFIGYKLNRIGKKYIDQMTKERMEVFSTIQKMDKSIKDTEKLLESFIPNVNKILQQRREKELMMKGHNDKEE